MSKTPVVFASLAVLGIWLTRYLADNVFTFDIDEEATGWSKEKNRKELWGWFCVFMYSYEISVFLPCVFVFSVLSYVKY